MAALTVVALNRGSSSLKYAAFAGERPILRGAVADVDFGSDPLAVVFDRLGAAGVQPDAIGHRLVHGGPHHLAPEIVTDALLSSLAEAIPFAPLHLPVELAAIGAVARRYAVPQVVCFDTGFHRSLPEVARRFPLPDAMHAAGIRRYGFHGLSYEFIVEAGVDLGRAVIAHLGSGASMVAVKDGKSVDTTMGMTPTAGLVMGTRAGDLDPGLMVYLLDHGWDTRRLDTLVNRESGLLALGGTSDMKTLTERAVDDPRAALAIDVFCHQARKWIGALTTTIGGLDTLVFTGGIGAEAAVIRRQICAGIEHLGVRIDDDRNRRNEPLIDDGGGSCRVRVMKTDEERMIARHTSRLLAS